MKPVKAWAFKDLVGDVFASTNKEEVGCAFHHSGSPNEVRPVTIQSAEWLTREAFEAHPIESPFGFWVWYLTDGVGRVEWSDYCRDEREFVQQEDYLDKDRVTHVMPIHPPEAPEVD